MKKILVILAALFLVACSRIETGQVGLRVGFDKQVSNDELLPGSFNQVIIGDVLKFPIKEVTVKVENMTPLTKDNSTMKDLDVVVVYNINSASVSDLYIGKNKSFHLYEDGDTYLMYNYIQNITKNAIYKSARKYDALTMNDARQNIEIEVKEIINNTLEEEHLENAINISQILVRAIVPADAIVESANNLVRAKNALLQKEVEVGTATKEAERIGVLNANKGAVEYMNAMALMNISEGIKEGKVSAIVVPYDFKGIVNIKP
jgi:hypothetical protein